MKIDKIPPMFNNLHGNVHNEIGPTQRAGKDKFVKNKKNYCNEKGECGVYGSVETMDVYDDGECKHYLCCDCMEEYEDCTCRHAWEMCSFMDFDSDKCINDKARKEAGLND